MDSGRPSPETHCKLTSPGNSPGVEGPTEHSGENSFLPGVPLGKQNAPVPRGLRVPVILAALGPATWALRDLPLQSEAAPL